MNRLAHGARLCVHSTPAAARRIEKGSPCFKRRSCMLAAAAGLRHNRAPIAVNRDLPSTLSHSLGHFVRCSMFSVRCSMFDVGHSMPAPLTFSRPALRSFSTFPCPIHSWHSWHSRHSWHCSSHRPCPPPPPPWPPPPWNPPPPPWKPPPPPWNPPPWNPPPPRP